MDENAELTDETQVKDEKIKELENRLDAKEKLIDELEKAAGKMAGKFFVLLHSSAYFVFYEFFEFMEKAKYLRLIKNKATPVHQSKD